MDAVKPDWEAWHTAYMKHEISHDTYYHAIAEAMGWVTIAAMVKPLLPRIATSTDPHLNDIPLQVWDRLAGYVWQMGHADYTPRAFLSLARIAGLKSISLAEAVCILKHVARVEASRLDAPAAI